MNARRLAAIRVALAFVVGLATSVPTRADDESYADLVRKSGAALTAGDPAKALSMAEAAAEADPNGFEAHVMAAYALTRLDRRQDASPHLTAALRLVPDDRRRTLYPAIAELDPDRARELRAAHLERADAALAENRMALAAHEYEWAWCLDASATDAALRSAGAYVSVKMLPDALRVLRRLRDGGTSDSSRRRAQSELDQIAPLVKLEFDARWAEASADIENKKWSAAIGILRQCLDLDPTRGDAHLRIADCWFALGDAAKGLAAVRDAVKAGCLDEAAYRDLARRRDLWANAEFERTIVDVFGAERSRDWKAPWLAAREQAAAAARRAEAEAAEAARRREQEERDEARRRAEAAEASRLRAIERALAEFDSRVARLPQGEAMLREHGGDIWRRIDAAIRAVRGKDLSAADSTTRVNDALQSLDDAYDEAIGNRAQALAGSKSEEAVTWARQLLRRRNADRFSMQVARYVDVRRPFPDRGAQDLNTIFSLGWEEASRRIAEGGGNLGVAGVAPEIQPSSLSSCRWTFWNAEDAEYDSHVFGDWMSRIRAAVPFYADFHDGHPDRDRGNYGWFSYDYIAGFSYGDTSVTFTLEYFGYNRDENASKTLNFSASFGHPTR